MAPAGKLYAEFTTPADKWVELTYREVTKDQERFFYRVYTGYGAVTLDADVRIGNLKAGSDASGSTLKLVTNAPSLVGATAVTILPVFGTATAGGRASGGLTTNAIARVIPPNTKFLIEFDNQSAAPGLRQAVATGSQITVAAGGARMMAFDRNAIQLVTRAPALPNGTDMAQDSMMLTDPVSGLTFEVRVYYGYRKVRYEVALAWGVKNIKPEHTAILAV